MEHKSTIHEFRYKHELAEEWGMEVRHFSSLLSQKFDLRLPRGKVPPICAYFIYLKMGFPPNQDKAQWDPMFAHKSEDEIEKTVRAMYPQK